MGTSEKRPDLAMGRRPIDNSEESALVPIEVTFGNFWLTIQNTTNRHVSNAFDLIVVLISFPLARAAAAAAVAADFRCCCLKRDPIPGF